MNPEKTLRSVTESGQETMRHNTFQDVDTQLQLVNTGRIQSVPGSVGAQIPGTDHPTHRIEEEVAGVNIPSVAEPTDIELRKHAIGLLDAVRQQYESSRLNRIRYMQFARSHGLTLGEIGEVLGISAEAVRRALLRAGDLH